MVLLFFRFLSLWPLWLLHSAGAALGWVAFIASPTYRKRLLHHAHQAGVASGDTLASVAQAGKMVMETPKMWMGRLPKVQWSGIELIEQAYAEKQGLLFLMPHLGSFEIIGQAWARHFGRTHGDFTVLFRPPRQRIMEEVVATSRNRAGLAAFPTTAGGVRQLLKALKQGRAVGVLPDQVPPEGMGVWAPFFGQPAYTMTLAARLAQQSGSVVLVGWGERLSWARGYRIHVEPLLQDGEVLSEVLTQACMQINVAMERAILKRPSQYLWSYARYKQPRKAST